MRCVHTALEPSERVVFRCVVSPACVGAGATVAGVAFVWPGVCVTPSPSCRPWLHGRYPLHCYSGGSDSRAAPVEHRRGSLCLSHDAFGPFSLQPPSRRVQSPDGVGAEGWTCALRRRLRLSYAGSSVGLAESSSPSLTGWFGTGLYPVAAPHPALRRRSSLRVHGPNTLRPDWDLHLLSSWLHKRTWGRFPQRPKLLPEIKWDVDGTRPYVLAILLKSPAILILRGGGRVRSGWARRIGAKDGGERRSPGLPVQLF